MSPLRTGRTPLSYDGAWKTGARSIRRAGFAMDGKPPAFCATQESKSAESFPTDGLFGASQHLSIRLLHWKVRRNRPP